MHAAVTTGPRNKIAVVHCAFAHQFPLLSAPAGLASREIMVYVNHACSVYRPCFWPDDYQFHGCHCIYAEQKSSQKGENTEEHSDLRGGC